MEGNKKKIKFNNLTNLHDVRFLASLGVEYISLDLTRISYNIGLEIVQWIEGERVGIYIDKLSSNLDYSNFKFVDIDYDLLERGLFTGNLDNKLIVRCSLNEYLVKKDKNLVYEVYITDFNDLEHLISGDNVFINVDNIEFERIVDVAMNFNISLGYVVSDNYVLNYDRVEELLEALS